MALLNRVLRQFRRGCGLFAVSRKSSRGPASYVLKQEASGHTDNMWSDKNELNRNECDGLSCL